MSRQVIRDRDGRTKGYLVERKDGRIELQDPAGNFRCSYDPLTGYTRDRNHQLVGRGGNQLPTLIDW